MKINVFALKYTDKAFEFKFCNDIGIDLLLKIVKTFWCLKNKFEKNIRITLDSYGARVFDLDNVLVFFYFNENHGPIRVSDSDFRNTVFVFRIRFTVLCTVLDFKKSRLGPFRGRFQMHTPLAVALRHSPRDAVHRLATEVRRRYRFIRKLF